MADDVSDDVADDVADDGAEPVPYDTPEPRPGARGDERWCRTSEDRRASRRGRSAQLLRAAARHALTAVVTAADRVVPKRPDRLVLGADDGRRYAGNPRHLFEHLLAEGGWDAYWITASDRVHREVEAAHPGRAVRATSARALRLGLTSAFFVVSHSPHDVGLLRYSRLPRVIQMTHGAGPKTMGYAKRRHDPAAVRRAARTYAHVVCSSDFEATFWERAYGLPREAIWATGVPRNEPLLRPPDRALAEQHPVLAGRVVLYAPTFRDWALLEDYLPVPHMDALALVALLERHDATLLVRPHYYEADAARATIERVGSPRVRSADDATYPDTAALLPHVDVLITDYSSIYTDFLLLDRPVVFTTVDLQAFEQARGFFFDYSDDLYTPGAKAVTGEELLRALDDELSGRDPYRDARAASRALFHNHPEGGSPERIVRRIRETARRGAR